MRIRSLAKVAGLAALAVAAASLPPARAGADGSPVAAPAIHTAATARHHHAQAALNGPLIIPLIAP